MYYLWAWLASVGYSTNKLGTFKWKFFDFFSFLHKRLLCLVILRASDLQ